MKKLIALCLAIGLVSCGSGNSEKKAQDMDGRALFKRYCVACHQADGAGIEKVFPPLKNSDYLMKDPKRAIHNILKGMRGEIVVNGVKYNGIMAPLNLSDQEIVAVVNYVLKDLNGSDVRITEDDVKAIRKPS